MKKVRKLLCVVLSLLVVLCLFPVTAQAAVAPSVTGAVTESSGGAIIVSFDQNMNDISMSPTGFSVKVNFIEDVINSISYSDDHTKYRISLQQIIQPGDTVTLSYTPGSAQAESSGMALGTFGDYTVTNTTTGAPPSFFFATVSTPGTDVSISFHKNMASPPVAPGGFTVKVAGVSDPVVAISHPGTGYVLQVATPIRADQGISVSYTPGTVTSADGGVLAAFSDEYVANYIDLRLTNISLSGSPSNYTFDPETTTYDNVTVAGNVESIIVTPTGLGVIKVNGTTVASGAASAPILLTPGVEQSITVNNTCSVGSKSIEYTINVTREAPQATPAFSPAAGAIVDGTSIQIISSGADHIYYTLDGTNPATSVTGTTMEYNDSSRPVINSGTTVKAIAVKLGKVDSGIGSTSYTQVVSGDLTGLVLSGSHSNYTFSGSTYNYIAVTVPNAVPSVTVTPTGTGTITVDGITVASGATSGTIDLTAGIAKTITVSTTETGKSAKLYTITVTRNLPALAAPAFAPSSGAIADGTSVQIISAGADHIYYTLDGSNPASSVTGTTMEYNESSRPVINSGTTVEAIAVKAGCDNSTIGSASYTQAASADLTGLALSGSPSNYTFSGSTYNYTAVTVSNAVTSVTVTPTGIGTITVDGDTVASGAASGTINLTAGTERTIVVIATEAGKSPKTYTIKITRANPYTGSSGGGGGGGGGGAVAETGATTTTSNSTATIATVATPATTDTNGNAAASVTGAQVTDAINKAVAGATAKGSGTEALVEIKVEGAGSATSISTTIPQASFTELSGSSADGLKISTPVASVTFDVAALDAIKGKAAGDIKVTAALADTSGLSSAEKEAVNGRPVYDLTITSGNTTISSFGDGSAAVSIPYKLSAGEDASKIIIYYLSDSGELAMVQNCSYDAATGRVTFRTNHFSNYVIGYNNVNFSDVSGWYKDYVNYLAAREIINGTGNGTFNPNTNITRAQFVTILANLSGADLSGYTTSSFSDVSKTAWYSAAVQWAYEKGIVTGAGGKFEPNANITRQDMAVMITRYAEKAADYTLLAANKVTKFTDSKDIGAYASDAVTAMQQAGIISGNSDGSFTPAANASRAQAAKMIALLQQGMVK